MTHVGQSSDVPGLQVSAPGQPDLRAGCGGQADALSPRPAAHPDHARTVGQVSRRQLQIRRASRRYYRRIAAERRRAGLTTRGKPRKYQVHPQLNAQGLHGKARDLARQRLTRRHLADQGLTTRGTQRIKRAPLPMHQRPAAKRRWSADYYETRRQAFLAQGLTTHGKIRRRRLSTIPTERERAWRELRATMTIPATEFLTPADRAELL